VGVPFGKSNFLCRRKRKLPLHSSALIPESKTASGQILPSLAKDPISFPRLLYNLLDSFPQDFKTEEGRLKAQESLYFLHEPF
jgi:hypothetical protein